MIVISILLSIFDSLTIDIFHVIKVLQLIDEYKNYINFNFEQKSTRNFVIRSHIFIVFQYFNIDEVYT